MYKTILVIYEELETYLNKKWYIFVSNYKDQFIFKYKEVTSRQLVAKKEADKFFDQFQDIKNPVIDTVLMTKLADELWIEWVNEKRLLAKFLNYWRAWTDAWEKPQRERTRDKLGTFELAGRFRTIMSNEPVKAQKSATITTFW